MKHRVINATAFKAQCLALLDEVADQGATVTVMKRGKPVAKLQPLTARPWKSPAGIWAGKVKLVGDIVNFNMDWDVVNDPESVVNPRVKSGRAKAR